MSSDPVIRTDQTRCFDQGGRDISCPGTGQDGALRPGAPWPEPRFIERNGAVVDRLSGLFWKKDAGEDAFPMSWAEAAEWIASLNEGKEAGRTDWRLPDRIELFSLVSHARINPAIPAGHPFSGVFPGYYWSGTSCAAADSQAWYVHFGGGRIYKGMKHGSYMVWPAAGLRYRPYRRPGEAPRFHPDGDTATDRATGRMWVREPGMGKGAVSWTEAMDMVEALNRARWGGFDNWRLPGVRELESLVDLLEHSPALPEGHPFAAPPQGCWTATTSVYEPSYAWVVYFREGAVGVGFKPAADFGLWPVRSLNG